MTRKHKWERVRFVDVATGKVTKTGRRCRRCGTVAGGTVAACPGYGRWILFDGRPLRVAP